MKVCEVKIWPMEAALAQSFKTRKTEQQRRATLKLVKVQEEDNAAIEAIQN